jgi:urea transport system ATP-binding protein
MLEATGINQFYGGSHILWDASLRLEPGTVTCLMGRNGVGKTTFLKVLMGLLPAKTGTLLWGDQVLLGKPADQRARVGIGYVPQGREIFPSLSVEENLLVPLVAVGALRHRKARLARVYGTFPVLEKMRQRRGGDLSGGQQQQLAIGRALMLDPKLLVLDEPTEGIQPNVVHEIGDVLLRLNREDGLGILLVEQKLPFARRVAQEFVIMERGRIVARGPMGELDEGTVARHLAV